MNGNAFLDTNMLIYFNSESEHVKRNAAHLVLNNHSCITSIQALNEASNVWLNKCKWNGQRIENHLDNIELVCDKIKAEMFSALIVIKK